MALTSLPTHRATPWEVIISTLMEMEDNNRNILSDAFDNCVKSILLRGKQSLSLIEEIN